MPSYRPGFDISPFVLPDCAPGEYCFEETRDIREVAVTFRGRPPSSVGLSYMKNTWPRVRLEEQNDLESPTSFGWNPVDDLFNGKWQKASVLRARRGSTVNITFRPLARELPREAKGLDFEYRRTMGIRIDGADPGRIARVRVHTTGIAKTTVLRVEFDAGKRTARGRIRVTGYNARVTRGAAIRPGVGPQLIAVAHMTPAHRYAHDDGHLTFAMGHDAFTISLNALGSSGPVWYAEEGVYITDASDPTRFADYRKRMKDARTTLDTIRTRPEQSYAGARNGQPRPHPVSYNLGFKHARQRFWLEADGDLVLHRSNVGYGQWDTSSPPDLKGADTDRFLNEGNARFLFGFAGWTPVARYPDPAPVPVYNHRFRNGPVEAGIASFCVPLAGVRTAEVAPDETMVALVRFTFRNSGDVPWDAVLPVGYSRNSNRTYHPYHGGWTRDDELVPHCEKDRLTVRGDKILGPFRGKQVVRCVFESEMKPTAGKDGLALVKRLNPGEECEAVLKVPYIGLDTAGEFASLRRLDYDRCQKEVTRFWRDENRRGSEIETGVPQLDALYASHLTHVEMTDFPMPNDRRIINTSVGTSTYGNYPNESCMIVNELGQRGFHDDARRRLMLWVKYQGTVPQPGNFTDCRGMYFGAGGFESGAYNQHHGWVLWALAEHYRLTRDREWLAVVAPSMVDAADWVFRQRRNTMKELPRSRGWERGFLPAGSLEDVTEFHYWLSTNALTWRGVDVVARALAEIGHPEAARLGREADAYRQDLVRGFEEMRRHTPLMRLKDGRWVPHYPSRLYLRGRDAGWIRETLEGSVYLLISGLYDSKTKQAGWILDDYQDNKYLSPPFGYAVHDRDAVVGSRGGFSIQPNLLAGLLPHLVRDEPETYIWMFFNAWCACYREEINAMVEHPMPELGYSNSAHFKTSDEANAVAWLRYMFVWADRELLHIGRAIPRGWFADGRKIGITKVSTCFGEMDVRYESMVGRGRIRLELDLRGPADAGKILARFRHPEGKRLRSVTVNGRRWTKFDPVRGDADLTGLKGRIRVDARF